MAGLSPTAIRIRNADTHDPSGDSSLRIYADLLRTHGEIEGRELWTQALNEIDDANGVEQADADEKRPFTMDDYREQM